MGSFQVKKFYPDAQIPSRGTPQSAGLDLHAYLPQGPVCLSPGKVMLLSTGIGIGFSTPDTAGMVYPRSGLALRHNITLINGVGVIDSDYTGEIKVPLINLGAEDFWVQPGDRMAQLVITKVSLDTPVVVDTLQKTPRGSKGFGSTGL